VVYSSYPRKKKTSRRRSQKPRSNQPGKAQRETPQTAKTDDKSNNASSAKTQQDTPKDKQADTPARKPRRRRSPYQTSGVKTRDNRPADSNEKDSTSSSPRSAEKALVEKPDQPLVEPGKAKPGPEKNREPADKQVKKSKPEKKSEPEKKAKKQRTSPLRRRLRRKLRKQASRKPAQRIKSKVRQNFPAKAIRQTSQHLWLQ